MLGGHVFLFFLFSLFSFSNLLANRVLSHLFGDLWFPFGSQKFQKRDSADFC